MTNPCSSDRQYCRWPNAQTANCTCCAYRTVGACHPIIVNVLSHILLVFRCRQLRTQWKHTTNRTVECMPCAEYSSRKYHANQCIAIARRSGGQLEITDYRQADTQASSQPRHWCDNYVRSRRCQPPSKPLCNILFERLGLCGQSFARRYVYCPLSYLNSHQAIFLASRPPGCRLFTLDSINVCRKYTFVFDLLLSMTISSYWCVLSWRDFRLVQKAMVEHRSQMVWFRQLYVIFSRYMIINSLREMNVSDAELEIQIASIKNA